MDRILKPLETMDPQALAELQLERLKKQLDYVYRRSPFYRKKFEKAGLLPGDIHSIDDFRHIPFTTKDELRQCNNEFICVENKDIVDIGATTGTTGPPVILPATKKDWDGVVETVMRCLVGLDVTEQDVFQISVAFDQLFSAAPMFDDALKKMGVTTLRMGPGNIRRQLEIMKRVGATVIFATTDFLLLAGEEAKKLDFDPRRDFKLRLAILVGQNLYTEDWQPNIQNRRIREMWGVEVYSDYGSMEMLASFVECKQHGGHHVFADHFLIETVDPETGTPLPSGEMGELVATHLTREGMPLVRFRQGDITKVETSRCSCGRTTPRIMAAIGRVDQMLKVKGSSVYPEQIEEALLGVKGVTAYVIEAYTDAQDIDRIRVRVAVQGPQDVIFAEIEKAVKAKARIVPDVVEPIRNEEALRIWFSEGSRKAKRFWDKRKKPNPGSRIQAL